MMEKEIEFSPLISVADQGPTPLSIDQLADQAHLLATSSTTVEMYARAMRQIEREARP